MKHAASEFAISIIIRIWISYELPVFTDGIEFYEFQIIDCLVTNFHLPGSTPLLLVCAFANKDQIFNVYQQAIKEKYRFLSYGDGMLIV